MRNRLLSIIIFWQVAGYGMLPVIDLGQITRTIEVYQQLKKQFVTVKAQLEQMRHQFSITEKIESHLAGHYGMGNLFNENREQAQRYWGGDDWHASSEKNPMNNFLQAYQQRFPDLEEHQHNRQSHLYQENQQVTQTAAGAADYLYGSVSGKIERVQHLMNQIERADTQKAALDLNSRLLAELAFIQLDLLKLQTLKTRLSVMSREAPNSGRYSEAKFLQTGG